MPCELLRVLLSELQQEASARVKLGAVFEFGWREVFGSSALQRGRPSRMTSVGSARVFGIPNKTCHSLLRSARDIEWGLKDGKVFMLQVSSRLGVKMV